MKKNATPAEKMAVVVEAFRSRDPQKELLSREYHDPEGKCVVATDSRRMIATTYNYNPYFENVKGVFPSWEQCIPDPARYTLAVDLPWVPNRASNAEFYSFEPLRKACKAAVKLADATGANAYAWFAVAGKVVCVNPDFLADFTLAMEAARVPAIRFDREKPDNPVAAFGEKAIAVLMPIRGGEDGALPDGAVALDVAQCRVAMPNPKAIAEAWEKSDKAEEPAPAFPAWFMEKRAAAEERRAKERAEAEARAAEEKAEAEAEEAYNERVDAFFETVYNRKHNAGIIEAFNKVANAAWKRANAVDGRLERKEARKIARAEVVAWVEEALAKSPADFGDAEPVAEAVEPSPAAEVEEVAEPVALLPPHVEEVAAADTGEGWKQPRPVPVVDAGDLSTRETLENIEHMLSKVIEGTHSAPSVALEFIQDDLRKVRETLARLETVRDWGTTHEALEAVRAMTA